MINKAKAVPANAEIALLGDSAEFSGLTINASYGHEKVANGSFASDTAWTKGANWTISGGVASKSAGAANNLSQDTGAIAGERYRITYTVSNLSGGFLSISIGGVGGKAIIANGTYTEEITATGTGDLTFIPSAAGVVVSIDNVSVVTVTSGSLTVGGDLSVSGSISNHGNVLSNAYTVNLLDFGGVGDGATDNGPSLQKALDSIKTTGGTVFIPSGTWKFTTPVSIDWYNNNLAGVLRITGTGGSTRIKIAITSNPTTTDAWTIVVSSVYIDNLTFIRGNSGTTVDCRSVLKIDGSLGVVKNVTAFGMYIYANVVSAVSSTVHITDSEFSANGSPGDGSSGSSIVKIENYVRKAVIENVNFIDFFFDNGYVVIPNRYPDHHLYLQGYEATTIIVKNCFFDEGVYNKLIFIYFPYSTIENIIIENNSISLTVNSNSIFADASGTTVNNLIIRNNVFTGVSAEKAVWLNNITNLLFENNTVASPSTGVALSNVTRAVFRNNSINGGITADANTRVIAVPVGGADVIAPSAITVGASPFVYQNITEGYPLDIIVQGGTVSKIEFSRNGSTYYDVGFTQGGMRLGVSDYIRVTYSVTPTMTKIPREY